MPAAPQDPSPTPPDTHQFWRDWVLWLIVALTFALRIAYNLALHPDMHPPKTFVIDEREYFGAAHVFAEGRGFSYFDKALWVRPPLYTAAQGELMSIFGDGYLPILLFQSILSALTLPALSWIAYRAGGKRASRAAATLSLIYLPLTLFAGLLLSETLFIFIFAWALLALLKARESLEASQSSRRTLQWSILAGFLLGLGVLTRSTALGFVALAMIWLAWGKSLPLKRRLLPASAVLAVSLLMLLPWVARNYAAYGKFIPVDTTGGYNLWLASVGVRDEERLQADLLAIPNPGDRQGYAVSQALGNITADPLRFIGKGFKESLDLWLPSFAAEERQVRGYAIGRIPDWHLASLLLFDDTLYLGILLLSVIALAASPLNPAKSLTGLWVLLWVGTSFIFFAVTRFRLPIVACLIPWAGVGISLLADVRTRTAKLPRQNQLFAVAAGIAILVVVAPAVPGDSTLLGLERWGQQAPYRAAEASMREGEPEQAVAQYHQANMDLSDTRFGLAAALVQLGQYDAARTYLRPTDVPDRFEPYIIQGEIARRQGNLEDARSSFNARTVQVAGETALDWAWDHLAPETLDRLNIGSGLDLGYVKGFYQPETDKNGNTFRWSSESPQIRWSAPLSDAAFRWNGWRPLGAATLTMTFIPSRIGLRGVITAYTASLSNADNWLSQHLADLSVSTTPTLPPNDCPSYSCFSITTNGFVGGGDDPRLLGIRISTIGATNP